MSGLNIFYHFNLQPFHHCNYSDSIKISKNIQMRSRLHLDFNFKLPWLDPVGGRPLLIFMKFKVWTNIWIVFYQDTSSRLVLSRWWLSSNPSNTARDSLSRYLHFYRARLGLGQRTDKIWNVGTGFLSDYLYHIPLGDILGLGMGLNWFILTLFLRIRIAIDKPKDPLRCVKV